MTATSAGGKSNGASESDTEACSGLIEDLAKRIRPGSPAAAVIFPAASTTATSTGCTDSSIPERTTRTTAAEGIGGVGWLQVPGDLARILPVALLQLILEAVENPEHRPPISRH